MLEIQVQHLTWVGPMVLQGRMDFFQDIEKGSNSTTIKIMPLLPGMVFKIIFDIGIYDIGK